MIRIALADDHVILRKCLTAMINTIEGIEVVFEADHGIMLMDKLKRVPPPDIILLDVTMPMMDGFETAKWLKIHHPGIKVIALTMLGNDPVLLHMVKHGVRGYLLKDCDIVDLEAAIYDVYEHGYHYNRYLTKSLATRKISPNKIILSGQELVFLRWSCTELTHKEIAVKMQVSPRTIDGYRDALFRKLDINSRVGLVLYAVRNGFVQV